MGKKKDDEFKYTSVDNAWMGAYAAKGDERKFHKEMQKRLGIRRPKARKSDGGGGANDWVTESRNYGAKIAGSMSNDYDVRRTLEAKALAGDEFAREYAEKGVRGIEAVHKVNEYLKKDFANVLSKVERGQSLSNAFSSSNIFPSVFKQLLSSGDIGNQVAKMFLNIRDYLEQEVDTKKNIILTLLQPLVILFMGGFVMLIVLSIMLPLLQMNNLIFSI